MVSALYLRIGDFNPALRRKAVYQFLHIGFRHNLILCSVHEQSRRGTRRKKRKIIKIGLRCDGNETGDLRPTHQKLHADPGPEGNPRHPAIGGVWIERAHPIEHRGGIRKLAGSIVERALAAAHATEVETHDGTAELV